MNSKSIEFGFVLKIKSIPESTGFSSSAWSILTSVLRRFSSIVHSAKLLTIGTLLLCNQVNYPPLNRGTEYSRGFCTHRRGQKLRLSSQLWSYLAPSRSDGRPPPPAAS